ncbi:MAG: entericidin A/B family lipoprotein [Pseudomonadota bacterium]
MTAILILVGLAACETAEGFGRDVEKTGRAIQRTF